MTIRFRTRAICLLLAVSPAARAESDVRGEAEAGVTRVELSQPNEKYGEYTGIVDDKTYAIGRLDLSIREEARYLRLDAQDIGLDSRSVRAGGGEYGRYSIDIEHSEIPHLLAVDAKTPFDGAGSSRLTLPEDFVKAPTTSGMTTLPDSLKTLDLENKRDIDRFQASVNFTKDWLATFSFRREDKNGIDSLGGLTAQNGGRAASTILPRPIDYRTDDLRINLAYNAERRQLEFGYLLSRFSNDDEALLWDVPFLKNPTPATNLDYADVARIGLEPDNRYEQFHVSGGFNFLQTARLSAYVEAGRMRQNERLLPYSTDDIGGTAQPLEDVGGLPRSTAEAKVDVVHANLNLSATPLPRLGVVARFRFHQTDNRTPYTDFDRVIDDTVPQSASQDLYSRPYDYSKSQTDLSASYGFANGLHLRSTVGRTTTHYDYQDVSRTTEDTFSIRARKQLTETLAGSAGYSYADRRADDYNLLRSYETYFANISCPNIVTVIDPDTGESRQVDTCFDNHPDLRRFSLASRKQRKADVTLDYTPLDPLDVSLSLNRTRERYDDDLHLDDTYLGLEATEGHTVTLDVSVTPGPDWSVHAFFTNERYSSEQNGRSFAAANLATALDDSRNWRAEFDDEIDTLGAGGQVKLLDDRLVVLLDYTHAWETNRTRFRTGSALESEDMPVDEGKRQSVALSGTYALREELRVRLGIEYERYRSRNWSTDNITAGGTAIDQILPLVGPEPGYEAWAFTTSLIYDWE